MTVSNSLLKSRTLTAYNIYKAMLRRASEEDIANGVRWYYKAYEDIAEITESAGPNITIQGAVAATAALSPLTKWDDNLKALEELVQGNYDAVYSYQMYSSNVNKARQCLADNGPHSLSGQKVVPFFWSLMRVDGFVCVDSHMWNAVNRFGLKSASPTDNARTAIENAISMLASERGYKTFELQAILWNVQRSDLGHRHYG